VRRKERGTGNVMNKKDLNYRIGQAKSKSGHYVLTHMSFQTCMAFFLL